MVLDSKNQILASDFISMKNRVNLGEDKKMTMHLPKEEALKIISEEEYEMLKSLSE